MDSPDLETIKATLEEYRDKGADTGCPIYQGHIVIEADQPEPD
jgi:hypothetical protein